MPYTEPTNISGLQGMFKYSNTVTKGWFGNGVLIMLWAGTFLYLVNRGYEPSDCAVASGFFTAFVGVLLRLLDVIGDRTMGFAAFSFVIPIIWLFLKGR